MIRKVWRYDLAEFDRAAEMLDAIEWSSLLPDDVDSYWSCWSNYFLKIMELCIPHPVVKTKQDVPWMTRTISEAIKKRNALFRKAKRTGKQSDREKFNIQRSSTIAEE